MVAHRRAALSCSQRSPRGRTSDLGAPREPRVYRCTGSAAGKRGQRNALWFCLSPYCTRLELRADDLPTMLSTGGWAIMGNRGVVDAYCGRLRWINLSTMSSEVKVLSALAGGVFHLQQLLEEMEMPIMEPTICCSDNRGCVQVVEDPGRHRVNTTHVDASAFKVREYVQRRRVEVRWIPTGECLGDIFTKHTIEADQ